MNHPSHHALAASSAPRRRSRCVVVLLLVLQAMVAWTGSATWANAEGAPPYVLIVHRNNATTETSAEFVAQAFLKRVTRWSDGELIRPVDLHPEAQVRIAFSSAVLKRSVAAMRSYWQQRIFSGRELPPPELQSDEQVVEYVSATPGAIGYVSSSTKVQNAKVLLVR